MTAPPPMDLRRFDDFVSEARRRIPRSTPEWTDFNVSDPGMTLFELFAWLAETTIWQVNGAPERTWSKALELLGLQAQPATPACAYLSFIVADAPIKPDQARQLQPVPVRAFTQVAASGPDGEVVFETDEALDVTPLALSKVLVFADGGYQDHSALNVENGAAWMPFGERPQPQAALLLGFGTLDPASPAVAFPSRLRLHAFPPPLTAGSAPPPPFSGPKGATTPPLSPVRLQWAYLDDAQTQLWRELPIFLDDTAGLTREGDLVVGTPYSVRPAILAGAATASCWFRLSIESGRFPDKPPRLDVLRANTVRARHLCTVQNETLGYTQGMACESFTLKRSPVLPGSLSLELRPPVAQTSGTTLSPQTWRQVEDLREAAGFEHVFELDPATGVVRFGDGRRGAVPPTGWQVAATAYRWGGGARGNVQAGSITVLKQPLRLQGVTNPRATEGGRDAESPDDLAARAPSLLRTRDRAVSADDYHGFAMTAGGVAAARVFPLTHPDVPDVKTPGVVTIVIAPEIAVGGGVSPPAPPAAPPELCDSVAAVLDGVRTSPRRSSSSGRAICGCTWKPRSSARPAQRRMRWRINAGRRSTPFSSRPCAIRPNR